MTNPLTVVGPGFHRGPRRWSRSGLALLLVVVTGAAPSITEIEIVPSSVFVHHDPNRGTAFELEARLWTGPATARLSITESQGYSLTWTSNRTWLNVIGTGFRARAVIAPGAPATGTASVTVQAGGQVSLPTEIVLASGPVAGMDHLTATYTANKVPDAVVVNGIRDGAGEPCGVTLFPFVAGSSLGNVVAPCSGGWGVALLSVDHRLAFTPGAWTPAQEIVNAGALQGALRSIPVALRVMVGDDALSADELATLRENVLVTARGDLEAANGVLAETRTGVKLAEVHTATIEPSEGEAIETGEVAIIDCIPGDEVSSSYDYDKVLNVYYVNSLAGYRGRVCTWYEGRKYPIIYIGIDDHLQSTFVHEVGHALGLTLPYDGHTDVVGGLDMSNVMTSGYNDLDPGGRRRLSVGQVFRMNADSASWLNWALDLNGVPVRESTAPRLACQCGEADPAGRCPRLADDVARPSAVPAAMHPWDCSDKLLIRNAPLNERPVAIIAGRRWRAPPASCSAELPGWTANHWDGIYVGLDNLTRPGSCKSWGALFFRRHGARFLDLSEPNFTWTSVADELVLFGTMLDRVKIRVRVYNTTLDQLTVDKDVAHALSVFGPMNRSGILLMFDMNASSCPSGDPQPGVIRLCYVPGLNVEATRTGRRIQVGKRRPTTVSHFIGQALGLAPLATSGPNIPGNIMQPAPADRGKKLTLGQVYRINASLGVLPGCNPTPCPTLGMDVAP
jgi:hypothetical protein